MPLLDHFHSPWKKQRPWDGFHSAWANALAQRLNHGVLPPHHVAIPNVQLGGQVEIDVATVEETVPSGAAGSAAGPAPWSPPGPALTQTIDFTHLDSFEVQVFRDDDSPRLVAAIELVSPANKDRDSHRQAFIVKCAGFLQQGVGVLVVDIVTSRSGNLHLDLLRLFQLAANGAGQAPGDLYASAYRTVGAGDNARLEAWVQPLALAAPLPTMPLWISADRCVPVNLEESYTMARSWLLMS